MRLAIAAAIAAVAFHASAETYEPAFLERFEGAWTAEGEAFRQPARSSMTCTASGSDTSGAGPGAEPCSRSDNSTTQADMLLDSAKCMRARLLPQFPRRLPLRAFGRVLLVRLGRAGRAADLPIARGGLTGKAHSAGGGCVRR